MGSRTNNDVTIPARKSRRRLGNTRINRRSRKTMEALTASSRAVAVAVNGGGTHSILGKLEALKRLIPEQNKGELSADQLFKETADYILLLQTQVSILQELVEYYGEASSTTSVPKCRAARNSMHC